LEAALSDNWTVKAETLYYQLGAETVTIIPYSAASFAGLPFRQRFDDAGVIARVGVNYKFGLGAPLVMR
jgi:opacity protein-like surface antigen